MGGGGGGRKRQCLGASSYCQSQTKVIAREDPQESISWFVGKLTWNLSSTQWRCLQVWYRCCRPVWRSVSKAAAPAVGPTLHQHFQVKPDEWMMNDDVAWGNSQYFETHWFPRLRTERGNSILVTCYYTDLGCASDWLKICFSQSELIPRSW